MVGIGREEQAILSIEALLVARVPPRLAVASTQMLFARDARDAARALDPHHVRLERPLPAPRKDDGLALGLGDVRVVANLLHLMLFPFEEPDRGRGHALEQQVAANDVPRLHADEVDERRGKRLGKPREVDALQPGADRSKRRVLRRQQRRQDVHVFRRANGTPNLDESHVHASADLVPIGSGLAELERLRSFIGVRARDADRLDARVGEGLVAESPESYWALYCVYPTSCRSATS